MMGTTIEHTNADGKYSLGMGDMDHELGTYLRSATSSTICVGQNEAPIYGIRDSQNGRNVFSRKSS